MRETKFLQDFATKKTTKKLQSIFSYLKKISIVHWRKILKIHILKCLAHRYGLPNTMVWILPESMHLSDIFYYIRVRAGFR